MRWLLLIACLVAVFVAWPLAETPPPSRAAPAGDPDQGAAGRGDGPAPAEGAVAGVPRLDETMAPEAVPLRNEPVSPPAAQPADAPLWAGPVLRGRVFAMAGSPVAGARIVVLPVVEGRVASPAVLAADCPLGRAGPDGRFAVQCADGSPRDVAISAAGHAPTVVPAVVPGGAELLVRLQPAARLDGRLTGPPGSATIGAKVELWFPGVGTAQPERGLGPGSMCPGGQLVATTTTDAGGAFAFDDLPAGDAIVGVPPALGAARERLRLAPGVGRRVELQLAALVEVRGRVAGPPGGVRVFLYGGTLLSRTVAPAADGSFVFSGIPPGRYLIGALPEPIATPLHAVVQEYEVAGRSTLAREIVIDSAGPPAIDLPAPAARTGSVSGTAWIGGAPAAGASVTLEPVDGVGARRRRATVESDGSFAVRDVPGGAYDARLWPAGAEAPIATQSCRVDNGGAVRVTFAVP